MKTRSLTLTLAVALLAPLALAGHGPGGASGGQGGPPDHAGATVTKTLLSRAETSPDDDDDGRVETLSVAATGRERFRVVVCLLDPEAVVSITMDDGAGGILELGAAEADDGGRAVLESDTALGDDRPGGASSVAQLAERTVNMYDADGALLLSGAAPSDDDEVGGRWRGRMKISPEDRDQPRLKIELRRKSRDRDRLKLKVKHLDPDAEHELWVEDPESGEMVRAFTLDTNGRGRCKLKLKARADEDLIPGLGGCDELAGFAFQIRTADGETVMSGTFPTPWRPDVRREDRRPVRPTLLFGLRVLLGGLRPTRRRASAPR